MGAPADQERRRHAADGGHRNAVILQLRLGIFADPRSWLQLVDESSQSPAHNFLHKVPSHSSMEGGSFHIGAPPTLPVSKPTIPVSDLKQINLDIIRRRLSERLEEMTSVHRAHMAERDDVSSRVSDSHSQVHDGGGRSGELEDNYKFFQEMRAYVTDLVECLNEKVRAFTSVTPQHVMQSQCCRVLLCRCRRSTTWRRACSSCGSNAHRS